MRFMNSMAAKPIRIRTRCDDRETRFQTLSSCKTYIAYATVTRAQNFTCVSYLYRTNLQSANLPG